MIALHFPGSRSASASAGSDAEFCHAMVREHAHTFALASRLLPSEKRRAAYAVYAFCRIADDLVDETPACEAEAAREALEVHRARFIDALHGTPHGPLFRELGWAIRRYHIPTTPFHDLLNALSGDLAHAEMIDWGMLSRYCAGVASTVGVICAHVFGLPRDLVIRERALAHANTLGIALQLTNILRDVGEDAERGRCYLSTCDLSAHGLSREEILLRTLDPRDPRWQAMMRSQIQRARELYLSARPGTAMLDADARRCADLCGRGYAAILDAIVARDYDSLRGRARVGTVGKARIFLDAWRGGAETFE